MQSDNDRAVEYESFKSNMATALAAISRSFELMQANLLITRSISKLLESNGLVSIAEIKDQADQLALAVKSTSATMAYIELLLLKDDAEIEIVLQ